MFSDPVMNGFMIFFVCLFGIIVAMFFYSLGKAHGIEEQQAQVTEALEHKRNFKIDTEEAVYEVEVINIERKWQE